MVDRKQAAGSVWNVNSWHWEQKNYTPQAKKLLEEIILSISIEQDGVKVQNSKIKSINGDAEINVRKGKQILCYEFNVEVDFKAENDEEDSDGYFKIHDINPDDLDFEIDHVTLNTKNKCGDIAKRIIQKQMKEELKKLLKDFTQQLAEYESNPEKLKQDEQKRLQNQEATQKAREEKGKEKEKIFHEQKAKEQEMKEKFSQWSEK
ncbi:hypothetical protein ABPG72_015600 [Tetrahymena utriculariae]